MAENQLACSLEMGWFGYKESDTARTIYRELAHAGLPIAMRNLAVMYAWGDGIRRNRRWQIYWLEKAIALGNELAMYDRAMMLTYSPKKKERDEHREFQLFKAAAESGDEEAMFQYSLYFYGGEQVGKNFRKSFYWCRKAVENGANVFALR